MTSQALRRVGVPVAVAVVVLAVVLGVFRLADPPGSAPGGSVVGSPGAGGGAPAPGPDEPMSRFTSVAGGADGRSLEVQFWGGVEDCYRYTVGAEQTHKLVTLSLTEKTTFDGACIDLAQQYDRTVRLDGALGTRAVVDATTGEVLLAP